MMKTTSKWVCSQPLYRFVVYKSVDEKRMMRKEHQRMKLMNVTLPEYTGENPVHPWLDTKRIKMLLKLYQDMRNQNRHTFKLDKKDKEMLRDYMQTYSELNYLRVMQEDYWLQKHEEKIDQCKKDVETLPYILRHELERNPTEKEEQYYHQPEREPEAVYLEQRLRLMPEEDALNYELAARLSRICADRLTQGE